MIHRSKRMGTSIKANEKGYIEKNKEERILWEKQKRKDTLRKTKRKVYFDKKQWQKLCEKRRGNDILRKTNREGYFAKKPSGKGTLRKIKRKVYFEKNEEERILR